ncbi:MAG: poly-gamma-glutamate synthase PgsB [Prolixibacteraceae bacterium]
MLIATFILSIILGMLILEKSAVQRGVRNLQLRIHVNGTRGKSSLTEYIAAGLLNTRPEVMAKITGIIPKIIHNGIEHKINRIGGARVQEQFNVIRYASKNRVNSLILECMSINPELQRMEGRVFKPHIYVITNIKDDHREEMGKNIEEQATAICQAIPEKCTVITNEVHFLEKIRDHAIVKGSRVIVPERSFRESLENLPFGVFPENIELALTVCEAAGADKHLARDGILKYVQSSESPLTTLHYDARKIIFLNAFAVNDVESTAFFIQHWQEKIGHLGKISLVFNTRADRPIRTDLFAGWVAKGILAFENIIVTGDHAMRARYSLVKAGIDKRKLFVWRARQIENLKEHLFQIAGDGSLVVGIGNIGGDGFNILNKLR